MRISLYLEQLTVNQKVDPQITERYLVIWSGRDSLKQNVWFPPTRFNLRIVLVIFKVWSTN